MHVDHLAIRVHDIDAAARFWALLGYTIEQHFKLFGGKVRSYALCGHGPDIFISEGDADSEVGDWVWHRGPNVHHVAVHVRDVQRFVDEHPHIEWDPIFRCSCSRPLTQVFTKHKHHGVVIEILTRNGHPGFCKENVERLMRRE